MILIIIENYEKEIKRRKPTTDEKASSYLTETPNDNKLMSFLN
jgi:hypothetical protein